MYNERSDLDRDMRCALRAMPKGSAYVCDTVQRKDRTILTNLQDKALS
jgi:hypothetical protein